MKKSLWYWKGQLVRVLDGESCNKEKFMASYGRSNTAWRVRKKRGMVWAEC